MALVVKWTIEMDAVIRQQVMAGSSAIEIARILNKEFSLERTITRNSVIGRSNRINCRIGRKEKQISDEQLAVKKEASVVSGQVKLNIPIQNKGIEVIETVSLPFKGKNFLDLKSNECRYTGSVGKPSEFKFCGEPTRSGRSYCEKHLDLVYAVRGSK